MSVETITMVVGIVSMLLALAGGFGWVIRRMDARIDSSEQKFSARIDSLEGKVDRVATELVEVKIAVARIEGPPRHLLPAR